MNEELKPKRNWIANGAIVLAVALVAFVAGIFLFKTSAKASPAPIAAEQGTASAVTASVLTATQESEDDVSDSSTDIQLNDVRARWNNDRWEYSTDNGETWTDEAPEGFMGGEDGSLSIRQGEGSLDDFDAEAWEQELDSWLASIYEEVDNMMSDVMPEGYEDWSSFVRFGDAVARQTEDGQWEYSTDNGETWTNDAPEGFSVNEDGTRFSIGGDGEDLDNFDFESYWNSLWSEYYSDTSANKTLSV